MEDQTPATGNFAIVEEPLYRKLWYKFLYLNSFARYTILFALFLILSSPVVIFSVSFKKNLASKGNNLRIEAESFIHSPQVAIISDPLASGGEALEFDPNGPISKQMAVINSQGSSHGSSSNQTKTAPGSTSNSARSNNGYSINSGAGGGASQNSGNSSQTAGSSETSGGSGGTSGGGGGSGSGGGSSQNSNGNGPSGGGGSANNPTPTLAPGQPTYTPTPTLVPGAPTPTNSPTPIPTNTPTLAPGQPTYTPTPTLVPGAPTPTPTPIPPTYIYHQGLQSQFADRSYGYSSNNGCDTYAYYSYPCSYSISYNKGGEVVFTRFGSTLSLSGFISLGFKLDTGGKPLSDFSVAMLDQSGNQTGSEVILSNSYVLFEVNDWFAISIPLNTLNPQYKPLGSIVFKNVSGQNLTNVYYDDVQIDNSSISLLPLAINNEIKKSVVLGTSTATSSSNSSGNGSCINPPEDKGIATKHDIFLPVKSIYSVYFRIKAEHVGDSLYGQIDGSCPIQINNAASINSWNWILFGKIISNPGVTHTLTFYGEDPDVQIDQIIFSNSCAPSGKGDNCVLN